MTRCFRKDTSGNVVQSKIEEDEEASAEDFKFSAPSHLLFLAGYMDAVARTLTTDSVLYGLTVRNAIDVMDGELLFGVAVRSQSAVENWSKEFVSLADTFMSVDPRSRIGFYLVDYILWFKEFTQSAMCFKLECEPVNPRTIAQAVYMLKLEGNFQVVLLAQRLDKMHDKPVQIDL